jgi:hypothetical protein
MAKALGPSFQRRGFKMIMLIGSTGYMGSAFSDELKKILFKIVE